MLAQLNKKKNPPKGIPFPTRFILLVITISVIPVIMIGLMSIQSLQHHNRLVDHSIRESISIVTAEQIGDNAGLEKMTTELQKDLEMMNTSSRTQVLILIATMLVFMTFGLMMPWVFLRIAPFSRQLQDQDLGEALSLLKTELEQVNESFYRLCTSAYLEPLSRDSKKSNIP
ncbi:MAG: hypothetical protein KJ970_17690 [Candidatus Eisenbacteria bacterium]|uniref:Uncharacterized protein n=1 Tax=Eiseniibacteriota bacterium TaxID=2212470 RepID=A0A948WEG6_UNCEI|nr:hypothetical protein [Candidatus Eisenbacteria bacterium]MBU1951235.1 hypothetical protein [Candidatus Eisenbacteria bacterium]MBU2692753.1 hypothetical protein [Candidatus Eisenbacteria bacterium]